MDLAVSSRMKNVKTYKQKPLESYQRLNGLTYFEWLQLSFLDRTLQTRFGFRHRNSQ